MKKICILLYFCTICSELAVSQTLDLQAYENNQAKYWLYRERLKKYFMTYVGIGPTASLPASERLYGEIQYGGRTLKWGDATINLAEYISVLAMEIQLLGRAGYSYEDMRGTIEELYFAMSAFNRLDLIAETHYPAYTPSMNAPSLNGFFVRDDINIRYPDPNSNIMIRLNEGITDPNRMVSQFDSDWLNDEEVKAEMSIDQCYWMFMAMKIVMKCVPPTLGLVGPYGTNNAIVACPFTPWNGQVNYTFAAEARFITRRITERLRNDDPKGWNWKLRNPVHGAPVDRGDDATPLSYGIKGVYTTIIDENFNISHIRAGNGSLQRYKISQLIWNFLSKHADHNFGEDFKAILIGSIANTWNNGVRDENNGQISKRAHAINHHWVGMLHSMLYDTERDYFPTGNDVQDIFCVSFTPIQIPGNRYIWHPQFSQVLNLLSLANCNGVWKIDDDPNNPNWSSYEWSTTSLTLHPDEKGRISGICSYHPPGDYNGLDYMMIHNIWYLYWSRTNPSFLPPFSNMLKTVKLSGNLPKPTINPVVNYGFNPTEPFEYFSYDKITSDGTIVQGMGVYANVKFRATNTIDLLPGFNTMEDVTFEATVEPINCDYSDNDVYRQAILDDIINPSKGNSETLQIKKSIKTYPNPATDNITIEFNDLVIAGTIELLNASGQIIYSVKFSNEELKGGRLYSIPVKQLAQGLYVVKCGSNFSKFIKQ